MHRGRVLGELWGVRRSRGLDGRKLVLVSDGYADRVVVAMDTLDARAGQEVLVAFGSGARNVIKPGPHNREVLCDAAVALVTDSDEIEDSDNSDGCDDQAAGHAPGGGS